MEKLVLHTMPFEEFETVLKKCIREELKRTTPEIEDDKLLKIQEVVKLLRVSKVTLHKWRKSGLLPYKRIGNRVYFKKSEVIAALNAFPRKRRPE